MIENKHTICIKVLIALIILQVFIFSAFFTPSKSFAIYNIEGEKGYKVYKIFVVYSYSLYSSLDTSLWDKEELLGLKAALKEADIHFKIKSFSLRSALFPDRFNLQYKLQKVLGEIKDFSPDVIVTMDDIATKLIADRLKDTTIPIVFCGLEAPPSAYGLPAKNITGVIKRLNYKDMLRYLEFIIPLIKNILIVTDNRPASRFIKNNIQKAINKQTKIVSVNTKEEFKEVLIKNRDKYDLIVYPTILILKDKNGHLLTSKEIFKIDNKYWGKPNIATHLTKYKKGVFMFYLISGFHQGYEAGKIVLKILSGTPPNLIPISKPDIIIPIFNHKRAEELNIFIPPEVLYSNITLE